MPRGAGAPAQLLSLSPVRCGPRGSAHSPGGFCSRVSWEKSQVSLLGRKGKHPRSSASQRRTQAQGCRAPRVVCASFLARFDPRLSQPWRSPSPSLSSLSSSHLFFAPLQPETHFYARRAPSCQQLPCASGYPLKMKYNHGMSGVS